MLLMMNNNWNVERSMQRRTNTMLFCGALEKGWSNNNCNDGDDNKNDDGEGYQINFKRCPMSRVQRSEYPDGQTT